MKKRHNMPVDRKSKNGGRRDSFDTHYTSVSKYSSVSIKTMKTQVAKIRNYRRNLLSPEERAEGRLKNADAARKRDHKTQEINSKLILERFGLAVQNYKKAKKLFKNRQAQNNSKGIAKYAKQINVYCRHIRAQIKDFRLHCSMLQLPEKMLKYEKYFDSRRVRSNQESRHDGQRPPSGKLPITGRRTFVVAENTSGPSEAPPSGDSKTSNGQFNLQSMANVTLRRRKKLCSHQPDTSTIPATPKR